MRCVVLLLSILPGLLVTSSRAATINVHYGDDIAGAISSANSGDIVVIGSGEFIVRSPITVPSGVKVMGVSPDSSHIDFHIDGSDQNAYGFIIAPGAQDVTIEELDLVSNHGVIAMGHGSGYANIAISHDNIAYGGGQLSDGTDIFGISITVPNTGLQIVHNFFHDSPDTSRNWCIWYATGAKLDYNEFTNINDGGQINDPGRNVSFSFNYGTYMHRMGQEVMLDAQSTFTCRGNVFYDYVNPYFDTEGVSIVGESGEVNITNNFFDASMARGTTWGQADSGGTQRFGYAIECTGRPCNVSSNILIGPWADDVSSDIPEAHVTWNSVYGEGLWGDFDGEPGPFGNGTVKAENNSIHPDTGEAPEPPENDYAGPRKHSL